MVTIINNRDNKFRLFIRAILAGFCISLGCSTMLSIENRIIGSLMFSVGLLLILIRGFALFTGNIYTLRWSRDSWVYNFIILVGNAVGMTITRVLIGEGNFVINIQSLLQAKMNKGVLEVFFASMLCGILMYLACTSWRFGQLRYDYMVPLIISVFILNGFEHCIANMFYFTYLETWNWEAVRFLLVNILGNAVGGILFFRLEGKT